MTPPAAGGDPPCASATPPASAPNRHLPPERPRTMPPTPRRPRRLVGPHARVLDIRRPGRPPRPAVGSSEPAPRHTARPGGAMAEILALVAGLGGHVGVCQDVGHSNANGGTLPPTPAIRRPALRHPSRITTALARTSTSSARAPSTGAPTSRALDEIGYAGRARSRSAPPTTCPAPRRAGAWSPMEREVSMAPAPGHRRLCRASPATR